VKPLRDADDESVYALDVRDQIEVFVDDHRAAIGRCLDGLTEDQATKRIVASDTTLLGLVKHATFVEQVWFGEAVSGRSRSELGIVAGPDESFVLDEGDTIESVRAAHDLACQQSRQAAASLSLDDEVAGNRRGPLPLRWIYLHVLRELAQHCGHADILREQILAADG